MKKKTKWIIGCSVVGVIVVAFFVTSFALAGAHSQSVVAEWQSWGEFFNNLFTAK